MRCIIFLFLIFYLAIESSAQLSQDFEVILKVQSSPLKDQQSSGTCWSFATSSFIETEAIRIGKDYIPISPIYYVSHAYVGKAQKFIESKGESWFGAGDLTFTVLEGYEKRGAIPEEIYDGMIAEDWQHDHLEMDNLLAAMVKSIGTSGYGRIKPESWKKSIEGVLESYIGKPPSSFQYQGKKYTPKTFAATFIGIIPDNYIEITSYSHFDFFEQCVLDIPANWNEGRFLNLPIIDFEKVINHALEAGYSLAWDGDATEPNFDFESGIMQLTDEQEKSKITQHLRQISFEDKSTTDDHNMHIIGKAIDRNGNLYYMLKNSEGLNKQGGYIFMTKNALLLKTISVLVHKDAIPKGIKKKTYLLD